VAALELLDSVIEEGCLMKKKRKVCLDRYVVLEVEAFILHGQRRTR